LDTGRQRLDAGRTRRYRTAGSLQDKEKVIKEKESKRKL
jgi:hypothetical protein